jgi:hypothetical protein
MRILFIICFFIIISCGRKEEEKTRSNLYPIDPNGQFLFQWPTGVSIEEVIYLESLDSSLISRVEKIWISHPKLSKIYILDRRLKKIFVFNSNGEILSIFDKNGSGPGEYLEIRDVFLDFQDEEIHILDNKSMKIYDLFTFEYLGIKDLKSIPGDSNFTRFIKIQNVYYLWTNIPFFQRPNLNFSKEKQQFHLVRLEDNKIDFFVPYEYGVLNEIRFYPSSTKDEYIISPLIGKYDIKKVSETGVLPVYEFPFTSKEVPENLLKEMFYLEDQFLVSDYFKILTNFRESNRFLYFNFIGSEAKVFRGLFDKEKLEFTSIGRSVEFIPEIVYADADFFYSLISPDVLLHLIKIKRIDEKNTLLRTIDFQRIKSDDNPIVIKFSIK